MIKKFKNPCRFSTSPVFVTGAREWTAELTGSAVAELVSDQFCILVTLLISAEPPLISTRIKEEGLCHPAFMETEAQ